MPLVLALLLTLAHTDKIPVHLRVVDVRGNPVANAKVASEWMPKFPELTLPLIPSDPLTTNADGVAEGTVDGRFPIVLSALIQSQHLGGFVVIDKDTKDPVLTILPMQPVQFDYAFTGVSQPLKNAYIEAQLVVPTGAHSNMARPAYAFPLTKAPTYLPVGSYRLRPGADNAEAREQWLEIPRVPGVFHPPKFMLTATTVATLAGKHAPELTVIGAMNIGPKVTLGHFKGKWVLIDFWGTWCSACRAEMPSLIDFYTKNRARRSKFELLSLHDSTMPTVAKMKAEIAKIVKGPWKGKALPFPVLLDQGGKTVAAYGIHAFPTQVLIDPQGNIVDGGNLDTLKKKLATGGG